MEGMVVESMVSPHQSHSLRHLVRTAGTKLQSWKSAGMHVASSSQISAAPVADAVLSAAAVVLAGVDAVPQSPQSTGQSRLNRSPRGPEMSHNEALPHPVGLSAHGFGVVGLLCSVIPAGAVVASARCVGSGVVVGSGVDSSSADVGLRVVAAAVVPAHPVLHSTGHSSRRN